MSERFDRLRDIFALPEDGGVNAVLEQQRRLAENFSVDRNDGDGAAGLLTPLLEALNWGGDARRVIEAMPQDGHIRDVAELRAIMHRLGYRSETRKIWLADGNADFLPALLDRAEGPIVLAERTDSGYRWVDSKGNSGELPAANKNVTVYSISEATSDPSRKARETASWIETTLRHVKRTFLVLGGISCASNMLSLALPLLVMAVYNLAVASRSYDTLFAIICLIATALGTDLWLRRKRSRMIADLGARIDRALSTDALRQILSLPLHMTETAAVSSQIQRLKQFGTIRDAFTGHIATALLDLPFTVIFIAAIAVLGGHLVWIPVALGLVLVVAGAIVYPVSKQVIQSTGEARSRSQALIHEIVSKAETVRQLEVEDIFAERYRLIAREEAERKSAAASFNAMLHSGSQALVAFSGLLTLSIGALMVLEGDMNFGGLIAIMMLVWRVLSPMQVAFLSVSRIGQLLNTIRQVNSLMKLSPEGPPTTRQSAHRSFDGAVDLVGLGFRYSPLSEPAIRSVDIRIPAGQKVAIAGPSGAGKSTMLKLVLGLYQPQAGVIRLDGLDIRQLDPAEVRAAIGYCPQDIDVFSGTVAENLWFANPTADDNDMWTALEAAGVGPDDPLLPQGLATSVDGGRAGQTSSALRQILSLARVYVRHPSIMLFDEPGTHLDMEGDKRFIAHVEALGDTTTVMIATNRPSHMRACDRVLIIEEGMITADGPPEDVLAQMSGGVAKRA